MIEPDAAVVAGTVSTVVVLVAVMAVTPFITAGTCVKAVGYVNVAPMSVTALHCRMKRFKLCP